MHPGASPGAARVPKKEGAINPINPRGELARLAFAPVRKSSISRSIVVRSTARLAGSHAFSVLQGVVFFSYFISPIFVAALFESANKITLM